MAMARKKKMLVVAFNVPKRSGPMARKKRPKHAAASAPFRTAAGLKQVNCYLDDATITRLKRAAVDRDALLSLMQQSGGEWPADVVPTRGVSGVVAQILAQHFAEEDARAAPATTKSKRAR
jgi:hypothetical protein